MFGQESRDVILGDPRLRPARGRLAGKRRPRGEQALAFAKQRLITGKPRLDALQLLIDLAHDTACSAARASSGLSHAPLPFAVALL
jgi:hypothetical protein